MTRHAAFPLPVRNGRHEVRLRLIGGWDPVGALIRLRTNSVFSHVDLEDGAGWFIGARLKGGVQRRPPGYCLPATAYRIAVPVSDDTARRCYDFAARAVGTPYDTWAIMRLALGVAPFLAPRGWRNPARWYCFEFAFAALEAAGLAGMLPHELPLPAITANELIGVAAALEPIGARFERWLPV